MKGLWKIWMAAWWTLMLGAAFIFLLAAFPGFDGPVLLFYDAVTWPLDGQTGFTETTRPTAAVLGAVFLGFVLAIGLLMRQALAATGEAASKLWRSLTAILVVWYGADSVASVVTGIPGNAVSNTAVLAAYLVPLLASGALGAKRAPRSRSA